MHPGSWLLQANLRTKILFGVMGPLVLILSVFSIIEYQRHRQRVLYDLSTLASYTGRVIESDLRHQMMKEDFEGMQSLLDTIGAGDEFEAIYLLNTSGEVIFSPASNRVGMRLDNGQEDCQPCHSLPVAERPKSVVVTTSGGERVFRSMEPIENSPKCASCHEEEEALIGMLLIDISVAPFSQRLTAYLKENLLLWLSLIPVAVLVVNLVVGRFVLGRLQQMNRAIAGMGQGETPPLLAEGPPDEIGQLVRAFNTMTRKVETRTRQNRVLSEQLQRQSRQRGILLNRLITAQENERLRVARELHDELGQSLTGLALRAQAMVRYLETDEDGALALLGQMRSLIAGTSEQMYEIIMDLRPSILDDLGLEAAIRAHAERCLRETAVQFHLDASGLNGRLPANVEVTLFRIFQEALNNIVRHAAANQVRMVLACQNGVFQGEIKDNGRGFNLETVTLNGHSPRGLGLWGMQERVTQCGGKIHIDTAPGHGTRIRIIVSLQEVACDPQD